MSTTYLLLIPMPERHSDLGEALVRSASCFFEAQAATAERIDLGVFRREGRATVEHLPLAKFVVDGDASSDGDGVRALENVLRATAVAAGARAADLRVYASREVDRR